MELPQTLESLHHHLDRLVTVLQQEQEALLNPPQQTEGAGRLHHLYQEKQQQFITIEALEGECSDLKEALSTTASANTQALWQKVLELTDQAARLHQLNSTLIRHGLVHHQCVLNSLRQLANPDAAEPAASNPAPTATPARKTGSRAKKAAARAMQ
jgi:flagellar biosynthesis/type III secretory pathway chaperone